MRSLIGQLNPFQDSATPPIPSRPDTPDGSRLLSKFGGVPTAVDPARVRSPVAPGDDVARSFDA
jgi:hypothetical protein